MKGFQVLYEQQINTAQIEWLFQQVAKNVGRDLKAQGGCYKKDQKQYQKSEKAVGHRNTAEICGRTKMQHLNLNLQRQMDLAEATKEEA